MNKQVSNQKMHNTRTLHKTVTVDELSIFYRETGDPANPKLVLLHGFPASSHQYRNLISALADHFHVVTSDYPGFGNSDLPSPDEFNYTFDRLSDTLWALHAGLRRAGWLSNHNSVSRMARMASTTEHKPL
jgi:pimeloyl-ACP methyl ester carboxylesterase